MGINISGSSGASYTQSEAISEATADITAGATDKTVAKTDVPVAGDGFKGPNGFVDVGGVTYKLDGGQVYIRDKNGNDTPCGTCDDNGKYKVVIDGKPYTGEVGKLLDAHFMGQLSDGSKVDNLGVGNRTELKIQSARPQSEKAGAEPWLLSVSNGELRLMASSGDDQISVDKLKNGDINVSVVYADGSKAKDITLKPDQFTTLRIEAGKGNDNITISAGLDDKVVAFGGDGNDHISTRSKAKIFGQDGNDTIYNRGKGSLIDAGDGNDSITNFGDAAQLLGGRGHDFIYNRANGESDQNRIEIVGDGSSLGNGNDTILSQGNYVRIDASGGDDQVLAAGQHHVEVTGGSGLDELVVAGQLSRLSYENVDGETHEIKAFGSLADMIKKHLIRKPIAG